MSCFGCLKVFMILFNCIIFLAGAGILGVGIWIKVDSGSLLGLLGKISGSIPAELGQVVNVGYLLIAVGGVLLLMGFLGCWGALRENRCMLLTFFVIILIVFIAEVAGAVVVLLFKPVVQSLLTVLGAKMSEVIRKEYGNNTDLSGLLNTTMTGLNCCGFNNYNDFTGSPSYNRTQQYPPTCCNPLTLTCTNTNAANSVKNVSGCLGALVKQVEGNSVVVGAVALGIAALEISAMVVSMVMFCKIGSK